jgi:hypothetical protein
VKKDISSGDRARRQKQPGEELLKQKKTTSANSQKCSPHFYNRTAGIIIHSNVFTALLQKRCFGGAKKKRTKVLCNGGRRLLCDSLTPVRQPFLLWFIEECTFYKYAQVSQNRDICVTDRKLNVGQTPFPILECGVLSYLTFVILQSRQVTRVPDPESTLTLRQATHFYTIFSR